MEKPDILKNIPNSGCYPTGSRYTCDPPVLTTDQDWVLCSLPGTRTALEDAGFRYRGHFSEEYASTDYRLGDINVIVVDGEEAYERWVVATEAAKALNLQTRADRVKLFHVIVRRNFLHWPASNNFEGLFD